MHEECNAQRRQILKGLATALGTLPLWSSLGALLAFAEEGVSVKRFELLSRRLTGAERLHFATLNAIMQQILSEPWGKENLQRLADKLVPDENSNWLLNAALRLDDFDADERWFIQHLLTTWMTGIYFHERGNTTISYRYALMHDTLEDIRPIPGECSRNFGFWQYPPDYHE